MLITPSTGKAEARVIPLSNLQKNSLKLGMVAYTYNPALKIQRQEEDHKFKASLICTGRMNE